MERSYIPRRHSEEDVQTKQRRSIMPRKVMVIIMAALAAGAMASYAAHRVGGCWGGIETRELWKWHPDRTSLGGSLCGRYLTIWYNDPHPRPGSTWGLYSGQWSFAGVKYVVHANWWGYRMIHVRISLWVPAMLLGAYPASILIGGPYRRWRRRRQGVCLNCAYNLTGNISGICPECGTAIAVKAQTVPSG
jgi:hypothetical protein